MLDPPKKRRSAIGATYAFSQSRLSCASRPFTGPILNGRRRQRASEGRAAIALERAFLYGPQNLSRRYRHRPSGPQPESLAVDPRHDQPFIRA